MDYTKVNKVLIYAVRDDVKDFFPQTFDPDEYTLEREFFDRLLERPFMQKDVDDVPTMVKTIFNNAFYIATLIKLEPLPQMYLKVYRRRIAAAGRTRDILWCNHVMPATMALVFSLLRRDAYTRSQILGTIYNDFSDWAANGCPEGRDDFYKLVIDTPQAANMSPQERLFLPDFEPRDIFKLLEEDVLSASTIESDIDYVLERIQLSPDKGKRKKALLSVKGIIEEELLRTYSSDYYYVSNEKELWTAHERLKTIFKQEDLKWVSRVPDDDDEEETEEVEEKTENQTLKADNAALKTENEDLRNENTTLRAENTALETENEQLRQAAEEASQDHSPEQWEKRWEDTVVALLKPAFWDNEDDARDFLNQIRGLDSIGVAAVARQFVKDNKIIPRHKKSFIWKILHAANLYDRVEQNWGQQMDIKE